MNKTETSTQPVAVRSNARLHTSHACTLSHGCDWELIGEYRIPARGVWCHNMPDEPDGTVKYSFVPNYVVTMGGALTNKDEPYTATALKGVMQNVEKTDHPHTLQAPNDQDHRLSAPADSRRGSRC